MAKKIVWTKRANNKFNKIIDHLEKEWGLSVTQNFVTRTYDIIEFDLRTIRLGDYRESRTTNNQEGNNIT